MGLKEDYEKREGVKALTDEEFDKVKAQAAATAKERLKPLMGTEEEFQRRLDMEYLRRQQYEQPPQFSRPKDTLFYYSVTIPLEKVWAFFGWGK